MTSPVIARWDARLTNWALWYAGSTARGAGSAYDGEHGECAPRPPLPLVGEALDTQELVQQLSLEHHAAIVAVYVMTGTLAGRALEVGCSPETLRDRCNAAIFRLEDLDQKRVGERMRLIRTAMCP